MSDKFTELSNVFVKEIAANIRDRIRREELTMKCQYNVKYTTDPQHALTIYKECDSTIVEQVTITSKEAIDAIVKKIDDALKDN